MSQPHNLEATVFVYEHRSTGEVRAEYLPAAIVLGSGEGEWVHSATLEPRLWIQAHWKTVQASEDQQ